MRCVSVLRHDVVHAWPVGIDTDLWAPSPEAGKDRDHAENRENDQVNRDEPAEPAGARPRLKTPANDHQSTQH